MAVDRVAATAPERIYLIIGDDCPRDVDFSELGEVTWCEEEAERGIEYVRAVLSAQQSAQDVSVLRETLEDARRSMFAVLNQEPRMKAVAKRVLSAEIERIDRALLASTGQEVSRA